MSKGHRKQRERGASNAEGRTTCISDEELLLAYLVSFKLENLLGSGAVDTETKNGSENDANCVDEITEKDDLSRLVELSERL